MPSSVGNIYTKMGHLCCFRLSLTTRIIGTFGLSTSILMVNVLLSEFFSRESSEHFLLSVESWTILGTNWINLMRKAHFINEAPTVLACILSFAFVSLLVNAFLILGTNMSCAAEKVGTNSALVFVLDACLFQLSFRCARLKNVVSTSGAVVPSDKKTNYYLPWMYMNLFTIVDQSTAITLHLSHLWYCDIYLRSPWYMRVSSVYLILCMYFWTIVYTNKNEGVCRSSPPLQYTDTRSTIITITSDSNVPKSPSFVSAITNTPFVCVVKSESTPDLPPSYSTVTEKT